MTIPAALYTSALLASIDASIANAKRAGFMTDICLLRLSDDDEITSNACRRLAHVDGLVWC